MANLESLKPSISSMSPKEVFWLIEKSRERRRIMYHQPKRARKVTTVAEACGDVNSVGSEDFLNAMLQQIQKRKQELNGD